MVGAPVRRRQVAYVCERGLSIRRACALLKVSRSALRYESRIERRDAPVVAIRRELALRYPRYGYRRMQVFLERRGHRMSADRVHRIWRRHGFQVPRKRPRRRVAVSRPRPLPATQMEDWVRGVARTVPARTPAQLRQLQFHWGKPPPAEAPRT